MPRGVAHGWTRDELERVIACHGSADYQGLAKALGLKPATIYSMRQRIRIAGGIDQLLEQIHVAGEPLRPRRPDTLAEQLVSRYVIRVNASGRNKQQAQYSVTIPSRLGERWVALHGREVQFVPTERGILIVPIVLPALPELPAWAGDGS